MSFRTLAAVVLTLISINLPTLVDAETVGSRFARCMEQEQKIPSFQYDEAWKKCDREAQDARSAELEAPINDGNKAQKSIETEQPFAYQYGHLGLTLLYHSKCPIADPKDWRRASHVNPNGYVMNACWAIDSSQYTKGKTVTVCPVRKDANGVRKLDFPGCPFGDASDFIKGNPIPKRAF